MGDDDHLVGREQPQRVLEREDRVRLADIARGLDPALRERLDRGFETAAGVGDFVVHVACSEVERRLHERGSHDPGLCRASLGVPDDLAHQSLIADRLVRKDHDPASSVSRAGRAAGAVGGSRGHLVLRTLGSVCET
jgi:hypothetical protein